MGAHLLGLLVKQRARWVQGRGLFVVLGRTPCSRGAQGIQRLIHLLD